MTPGYTEVVVAELSRVVARRVAPWETPGSHPRVGKAADRGQWLRGTDDRTRRHVGTPSPESTSRVQWAVRFLPDTVVSSELMNVLEQDVLDDARQRESDVSLFEARAQCGMFQSFQCYDRGEPSGEPTTHLGGHVSASWPCVFSRPEA